MHASESSTSIREDVSLAGRTLPTDDSLGATIDAKLAIDIVGVTLDSSDTQE